MVASLLGAGCAGFERGEKWYKVVSEVKVTSIRSNLLDGRRRTEKMKKPIGKTAQRKRTGHQRRHVSKQQ